MAAIMCGAVMLLLTLVCQVWPQALIGVFSNEAEVTSVGVMFLTIISWNFVLAGINMTCSSMFQALGNTVPALWSSATRIITYALPAIWLSLQPAFRLEHVWYLNVGTVLLQTLVSVALLKREMRIRLWAITEPRTSG